MVDVFTIVHVLSLGATECLRLVLTYGLGFLTVRVIVFDLG